MRRVLVSIFGASVLCASAIALAEPPATPPGPGIDRELWGVDDPATTPREPCTSSDVANGRFDCVHAETASSAAIHTSIDRLALSELLMPDFYIDDPLVVTPGVRAVDGGRTIGTGDPYENRYFIDGLSTTDVLRGGASQRVPMELIDSIVVRAGGIDATRQGGTGLDIAVTTRRGGDRWSGSVFGYWAPSALGAEPRTAGTPDDQAFSLRYDQGDRVRGGFEVGGPAIADHLWLYVGVAPDYRAYDLVRTVRAIRDVDQDGMPDRRPDGLLDRAVVEQTRFAAPRTVVPTVARVDVAASPDHAGSVSLIASRFEELGAAGIEGTPSALFREDQSSATDVIGRWRSVLEGGKSSVVAMVGLHHQREDRRGHSEVAGDMPQVRIRYDDPAYLEYESEAVADACRQVAFDPCPRSRWIYGGPGPVGEATGRRLAASVAASRTMRAAGAHRVEVGVDVERTSLTTEDRLSGGRFIDAGTLVELVDAAGERLDEVEHDSVLDYRGVYLRDAYAPVANVTVDLGARLEGFSLRARAEDGGDDVAPDWQLSPRAQVSWDPTREGRARVFVAGGRYLHTPPLGLADAALHRSYQRRTAEDLPETIEYVPHRVAADLVGQRVDEAVVGGEVALLELVRLGITYQRRWLDAAIEDVRDGDGYVIANPDVQRVHDGVSVSAMTNPAAALWVRASYAYSRARGNYAGPGAMTHLGTQLDDPTPADLGALYYDRPHVFELDGHYRHALGAGHALTLATRLRALSGAPIGTLGGLSSPVDILPAGDAGRLDFSNVVNVRLGYARDLGETVSLHVFAEVLNVFNRRDVARVNDIYTHDDVRPIFGGSRQDLIFLKALDVQGADTPSLAQRNRDYGTATSYYAPLQARLGARLVF